MNIYREGLVLKCLFALLIMLFLGGMIAVAHANTVINSTTCTDSSFPGQKTCTTFTQKNDENGNSVNNDIIITNVVNEPNDASSVTN